VCLSGTALAQAVLGESAGINIDELLYAYNSRDFGSPGRRSVLLELVTDGAVTRAFTDK